jgi:hypothetical protein
MLVQRLESVRWEQPAEGEDAKADRLRRKLVRAYEAAAAQADGRSADPDTALENPRLTVSVIVDILAKSASNTEAARLLGLTEAEVAAARSTAHEARGTALAAANEDRVAGIRRFFGRQRGV